MSELIDRQALRAAHGLGTDCRDCKRDMKSCQYDRDYSLMDFCEWLDDAPTASPWHRVEEELPSMDGYDWVLGIVTGEAGYMRFHKAVMMVSFDPQYKEWFIDEYTDAKITVSHWMELPEPPKEDA